MTGPTTDPGQARSVVLVGRREFRTRLRSRPVVACGLALAIALGGFLVLRATAFADPDPVRVGLTGQAISLQDELPKDTANLGVAITVDQVPGAADGLARLGDGQLDVLVSGSRAALHVTVERALDPRLRATLDSLVRQQVLDAQLAQLGLRPADVLARVNQAGISVTQLGSDDPNRDQRIAVGLITATLLAVALALFGALAARGVGADKERRTAEALRTIVRPRRLLLGQLLGIGAAGAVTLLGVGIFGVLAATVLGGTAVPGAEFTALGAGVLWFAVGFGLYGTVFAACAALVARPAQLRSVVLALGGAITAVFAVSFALLATDPGGPAAAVLSVLPPFAPILLAGRMAAGVAPGWQVLLALVLALGSLAALGWFGGRVYVVAMPRTAGRVRLREALR